MDSFKSTLIEDLRSSIEEHKKMRDSFYTQAFYALPNYVKVKMKELYKIRNTAINCMSDICIHSMMPEELEESGLFEEMVLKRETTATTEEAPTKK
ncbi:MAG: hypothetical protein LUD72_13565 [Bacteroidales bacterium]|nr:hypothetical protein [Bacteroidales bacterium]